MAMNESQQSDCITHQLLSQWAEITLREIDRDIREHYADER